MICANLDHNKTLPSHVDVWPTAESASHHNGRIRQQPETSELEDVAHCTPGRAVNLIEWHNVNGASVVVAGHSSFNKDDGRPYSLIHSLIPIRSFPANEMDTGPKSSPQGRWVINQKWMPKMYVRSMLQG